MGIEEALAAEGEAAVATVAEAADAAGVDSTTELSRGVPHEVILDYVADNDIDLIVMATHGRTGFNRFLLGSVTEKVTRRASISVHVVRVVSGDGA